jgi:hypothetical protein
MFRIVGAALLGAATTITAAGLSAAPAHATAQGGNGFIAFQTPVDNHFHIALARADGSGYHVLTINGPGMALPPVLVQPAVSPDGTRIAFAESGGSRAVWTANADGSHVVRISVPPPSAFDWQPTWSPDGTKVYFTRVTTAPASSQIFFAYATAAAVARTFFTGPTTPHTLGLAVGSNWPDALAGGALLGAHTAPLLLAAGASLPAVEGDYAAGAAPAVDELLAFGGTDGVPDAAAFAVGNLVSVPGQRSFFVNRTAPFLP